MVQSSPRPLPRGALRRWTPALCAVWAAVQPSRRRALGVYIDQDVEDVCWSELEEQLATVIRERKPEAVIGFAPRVVDRRGVGSKGGGFYRFLEGGEPFLEPFLVDWHPKRAAKAASGTVAQP